MWNVPLPRLAFAALLLLSCVARAHGAAPEAAESPLPSCDSLVERYVFMQERSGSPTDVASSGWVLDEGGLYCEPFNHAPMPRTLRGKKIILTQHGIREGQWWYKVRYAAADGDTRQTGYIKGETVLRLSEFNACHNQRCRKIYYTTDHPNALILKTAVPDPIVSGKPEGLATKSLRIEVKNGPHDVRTTFFCNVDNKSLHAVELRTGEGDSQTNRILLVLADLASGEMSVIFDETGYGYDDGNYRSLAVYATREGLNRELKYLPEYADGADDRMPCDNKTHQSNKYIHIKEEKGEGLIAPNGELVFDEHGMVRSRILLRKEGWYEIVGNELRPVQP